MPPTPRTRREHQQRDAHQIVARQEHPAAAPRPGQHRRQQHPGEHLERQLPQRKELQRRRHDDGRQRPAEEEPGERRGRRSGSGVGTRHADGQWERSRGGMVLRCGSWGRGRATDAGPRTNLPHDHRPCFGSPSADATLASRRRPSRLLPERSRMPESPDALSSDADSPPVEARLLGRVVATERRPNTPHEFHFWTALDSPVGIGTIVRVEGTHPIEGHAPAGLRRRHRGLSYTDLASPLHDVHQRTTAIPARAAASPTERAEIRLYTAAVLRHVPDEPLQPVPMGRVFLGDDRRRRRRAADGRLPARRGQHRDPDRDVSRRRDGIAGPSRRRLPARSRSRAPQHHRRIGAGDQDLRGGVAAGVDLRALSRRRRGRSPRSAST